MTLRRPWLAAASFALMLAGGTAAHADTITIVNPGFESLVLGDGGFTTTAPPGWTSSGATTGTFNPTTSQLVPPTEGSQVAYLNGVAAIGQVLASTVAAGEYVLTADFAYRKDCCTPGPFTLSLLAGSTVLGSFDGSTANGFSDVAFKTASVSVVLAEDSPFLGTALGILIESKGGSQVDVDNVTLSFSASAPIPLPASGLLLAPALLGLARLARRSPRA